jgi:hypothetical protein
MIYASYFYAFFVPFKTLNEIKKMVKDISNNSDG